MLICSQYKRKKENVLSLFNSTYFNKGYPQKLLIFLHGYNGSPEDTDYAVQWLKKYLENTVVVVPRAPFKCEKNPANLQWLSFYEQDPDARFRHPEASVDEIFDIFNRLGDSFACMAQQINDFIDEQQLKFFISDQNTYLMGFSQGAMLSVYTSLTRKHKLAGCISVAGIIPGKDRLAKEIVSKPQFLLLHGKSDSTVQYKTLPHTLAWLKKQQIPFEHYEFEDLAHRMSEDEMKKAAEFVNQR